MSSRIILGSMACVLLVALTFSVVLAQDGLPLPDPMPIFPPGEPIVTATPFSIGLPIPAYTPLPDPCGPDSLYDITVITCPETPIAYMPWPTATPLIEVGPDHLTPTATPLKFDNVVIHRLDDEMQGTMGPGVKLHDEPGRGVIEAAYRCTHPSGCISAPSDFNEHWNNIARQIQKHEEKQLAENVFSALQGALIFVSLPILIPLSLCGDTQSPSCENWSPPPTGLEDLTLEGIKRSTIDVIIEAKYEIPKPADEVADENADSPSGEAPSSGADGQSGSGNSGNPGNFTLGLQPSFEPPTMNPGGGDEVGGSGGGGLSIPHAPNLFDMLPPEATGSSGLITPEQQACLQDWLVTDPDQEQFMGGSAPSLLDDGPPVLGLNAYLPQIRPSVLVAGAAGASLPTGLSTAGSAQGGQFGVLGHPAVDILGIFPEEVLCNEPGIQAAQAALLGAVQQTESFFTSARFSALINNATLDAIEQRNRTCLCERAVSLDESFAEVHAFCGSAPLTTGMFSNLAVSIPDSSALNRTEILNTSRGGQQYSFDVTEQLQDAMLRFTIEVEVPSCQREAENE